MARVMFQGPVARNRLWRFTLEAQATRRVCVAQVETTQTPERVSWLGAGVSHNATMTNTYNNDHMTV